MEDDMNETRLRKVAGIATIVFPILLLVGFALHPHLFSPSLTRNADDLIAKFRGNPLYHIGHLLVFLAVPLIVISFSYTQTALKGAGKSYGSIGGVIGIIGAIVLAGDKGALCIVLSAFDTLPKSDFESIRPALQSIVERRGLLKIFWALPLLPIGAIIQMIGMTKEKLVPRASGIVAIIGLVLLNNPDIDVISSVGALSMCAAYIPFGLGLLDASDRRDGPAPGSIVGSGAAFNGKKPRYLRERDRSAEVV
jgi:hypothetical protein